MSGLYSQTGSGNRYLNGDDDPSDFDWNDLLTPSEFLILLQRNGKIRKACAWVSREAVRPRFILKKEKAMPGTKFGKPYKFDSIVEYLEWIEFFTELEKVYTWARLFGTSIQVMFKQDEGKLEVYEPRTDYDCVRSYYPLSGGNGYIILEEKGIIYYKITFTNIMGSQDTFKVHQDRVVVFNAPHLELTYGGSSEIEPMAKLAIVQEQMFRSIMKRVHWMGAGISVLACGSEEEKTALEDSIGDALKYTQKIFTTGDPKAVLETYVPDLNAGQFREIWNIAQEEIATDMNMSKKLISGDPQGDISSAKWDTEISYTEVYQTQRHYKKSTETVLYHLGIQDTTFTWNDPFPTENMQTGEKTNARTPRTDPTVGIEDEGASDSNTASNSSSSDESDTPDSG